MRVVMRMHAVADYGGCNLGSVYLEVRCAIDDLLEASLRGTPGVRVLSVVRLALALQEALRLGPGLKGAAAMEASCIRNLRVC